MFRGVGLVLEIERVELAFKIDTTLGLKPLEA